MYLCTYQEPKPYKRWSSTLYKKNIETMDIGKLILISN